MERKSYAHIHVHIKDLYDAQNNDFLDVLMEHNAKGYVHTQHGVTSSFEEMRKLCAAKGLKVVPGCEAYYDPSSGAYEESRDLSGEADEEGEALSGEADEEGSMDEGRELAVVNEGEALSGGTDEEGSVDEGRELAVVNEGGRFRHLLLIAKNGQGWRTICKAITESNNAQGKAVLNRNMLLSYFAPHMEGHGNVIATSACMQGVIAAILRANEETEQAIKKLSLKQDQYHQNPGRIEKEEETVRGLDAAIEENKAAKAAAKKKASVKFLMRERQVAALRAKGSPLADACEAELEADKAAAAEAALLYDELTKAGKELTARRSAHARTLRGLHEVADRYEECQKQISALQQKLLPAEKLEAAAEQEARWFQNLFGAGNFYMEMQYHGIEAEARVFPVLAKIARKLGIPLVASNDVHMATNSEEDLLRRRILRSMRFGNGMEELQPGDTELYVKTDEELSEWLSKILPDDVVSEAMGNIRTLFDSCDVQFKTEPHYPVFPLPDGVSAESLLEQKARAGIAWRFPGGFPDERYEKRLQYELGIITQMGYSAYHLVVMDYLEYGRELGAVPAARLDEAPFNIEELKEWKKENGWDLGFSIGPGRGSAVGSLVCYLLGITALDPIKYGLLFERFLNPERVSMPDIDSDFANAIRGKVIEYVKHKYGRESVCGIMTTNAQAPKGAVRIAAKYYGYEETGDGRTFLSLADKIAKAIPKDPGMSFATVVEGKSLYDQLCGQYANDKDALEILRWARIMEGTFTAYGMHAAGIVISDGTPIKDVIPLRWNEKMHTWTTQMDMVSVEENGFLKMDFLGLKTLDIITDCIKMVQKTHGVNIDPLQIPLNDDEVFTEILQQGRTNSVFQFESSGMKNMLSRFRPTCFEDLIILVAMFRPGPLQYIDNVIKVKHGASPQYVTDKLKPILSGTYGAIVFQEQVMEIFQKLAGYTLGGADQVRRAMSKKKAKVLAAERPVFVHGDTARKIKGCVANGISEQAANALFDQMTEFARYAFNKSHAAAYALIGYYTAWLKLHYSAEFLAAAMNWAEHDGIAPLMQEAKKMGVHVKAPDVNRSYSKFAVVDGEILFGLGAVKTVGSCADEIIRERKAHGPYQSLIEMFARVPVKKSAAESLARAGAFDAFCDNRQAMVQVIPDVQKIAKKMEAARLKKELAEQQAKETIGLTDEEIARYQEDNDFLKGGKKPKTAEKFRAFLENREKSAERIMRDMTESVNTFAFPKVVEDPDVRMADEKEYLGIYVTRHPLDHYNVPEDTTPIADAQCGRGSIYGFIHDCTVKYKRGTQDLMAFFKVEDQSGEMDVCVFTQAYREMAGQKTTDDADFPFRDGNVVIMCGQIIDDEVGEKTVRKMYASSYKKAEKKKPDIVLSCSSYYRWVWTGKEQDFLRKYQGDDCTLYIYDELTGLRRKMKEGVKKDIEEILAQGIDLNKLAL